MEYINGFFLREIETHLSNAPERWKSSIKKSIIKEAISIIVQIGDLRILLRWRTEFCMGGWMGDLEIDSGQGDLQQTREHRMLCFIVLKIASHHVQSLK
jgi:hypothetical protein